MPKFSSIRMNPNDSRLVLVRDHVKAAGDYSCRDAEKFAADFNVPVRDAKWVTRMWGVRQMFAQGDTFERNVILNDIPEFNTFSRDVTPVGVIASDTYQGNAIDYCMAMRFLHHTDRTRDANEHVCCRLWNLYIRHTLADLQGISLFLSSSEHVNLREANLSNATLQGDFSRVNLFDAILNGANLRSAERFILDGNQIDGAAFSAKPNDPYSILRHEYTGPRFAVILLLSAVAMLPHLVRGFIPSTEPLKVWQAVLAVHHGPYAVISALTLILYNVGRAFVTIQMSRVRDAEERSRRAPSRSEYYPSNGLARFVSLYSIHHYFLRWCFWSASAAFIYKLLRWLSSDVPLWPRWPL